MTTLLALLTCDLKNVWSQVEVSHTHLCAIPVPVSIDVWSIMPVQYTRDQLLSVNLPVSSLLPCSSGSTQPLNIAEFLEKHQQGGEKELENMSDSSFLHLYPHIGTHLAEQQGANLDNLVQVPIVKWDLPVLVNVNVRSLVPKVTVLS